MADAEMSDLFADHGQQVWQYNLEEKLSEMMQLIESYDHIAVSVHHLADLDGSKIGLAWSYDGMKEIVDANAAIQITFSLFNRKGLSPYSEKDINGGTFQFKLKLDKNSVIKPMIGPRYQRMRPILQKHRKDGIDANVLAERLLLKKLFVKDKITWLTLNSMYEVSYMVKFLSGGQSLPADKESFMEKMKSYFRKLYDVRYLAGCLDNPHSMMDNFTEEWRSYDDKQFTGMDAMFIGKWFFIFKFEHLPGGGKFLKSEWNQKIYVLDKLDNPNSPPLVFRKVISPPTIDNNGDGGSSSDDDLD